jgi:hypothetical protein
MDAPTDEFVPVVVYDTDHGRRPKPLEALQAWLRERGIDEMPFGADDVLVIAPCGRGTDGNWDRSVIVHVRAAQLRRLGLHP